MGIVVAALLGAYAIGALNPGSRAGAHSGWTEYRSAARGFSVEYPASWRRSASPMFPAIINPRSILTVSTFAIPPARDAGECGFFPSRVRAHVGRDGAVVTVYAYHLPPGDRGRRNLRKVPARPASFQLHGHSLSYPYFQTPRGRRTPGADAREWVFPFRDRGRVFTAAVLLGTNATAERRRDVVALLDSLHFRPRTPGGAS